MLSQLTGAANDGGTPLDDAAIPVVTGDLETPPPTAEVRPIVASGATGSRKNSGGIAASKNSINRDFQFFFEDEVFRIDRKGRVRFGVITGTAESYSSEDEEEDDIEALGKGEVRCAFYPDGKEVVRTEKSIGLADRTLMPGDVVRRRLPGQKQLSGQAGYVRDVNVRADVKVLGTKHVIRNVPSERLRPISEWSRDVPVSFGNWIGYTVCTNETAVLKTCYGALLEITSSDFHKFKDAYSPAEREVFCPSIYYPNNVVIGRLPPLDRVTNLTPNIPIANNRKRRCFFTVDSVKTNSITIAWTFKATPHFETSAELDPLKEPKTCVKGDDLANVKRLNIYESYMLQIHDRFYLKYSKCDKLVRYSIWEQDQDKLYKTIYERQKSGENKQCQQDEQGTNNTANEVQLDSSPSASAPSVSRKASIFKLRRVNKPCNCRIPSQLTHALCSSANISDMKNSDDNYDTIDEDADFTEEISEDVVADIAEKQKVEASTNTNSYASQAARIITRNIKRRHTKKRGRPTKRSAIPKCEMEPKDGDEMVVETLVVYSSMTVVWQDGTVETCIPSTELYPIHHLDNHEFFPGDFVSRANDCSHSQMDYGVIQSVDHDERIAKVKWFHIYCNADNPVPSCKEIEELSVYDLKDHVDYQYRPGTIVIRVSNFTGEDLNSTVGQVIDNFPDGRVRVWWVKGHITMCYPQDLFEIHQNDSQDAYESDVSDNSWETQSETSQLPSQPIRHEGRIINAIDRAKDAVDCLEKIFHILPESKKSSVIDDLLAIFKNCNVLDHYLHTDYFHEDYFNGIMSRKRKCKVVNESGTNAKPTELIVEADVVKNTVEQPATATVLTQLCTSILEVTKSVKNTSASTPNKRKSSTNVDEVQCKKSSSIESINVDSTSEKALPPNFSSVSESQTPSEHMLSKFRIEFADVIKSVRETIVKAMSEKRKHDKNDSGVFSRGENSSSEFTVGSDGKDTVEDNSTLLSKSVSETSIELVVSPNADVCEIFFFLFKEQLLKCRDETIDLFKAKKEAKLKEFAKELNVDVEDIDQEIRKQFYKEEFEDQDMEEPLNLNALSESLPSLESPTACSSPSPMRVMKSVSNHCFEVVSNAPASHNFIGTIITPNHKAQYQRAVQREYAMLYASLPPGVVVRAYEDRMDLMSVMMVGPKRTPYQNALFFFDFQMGSDYPKSPPTCHYISYCTERLNPNLYEEGKVCVSLLGTWSGRDNEVWTPQSTMLQVLVSIQGLILVDEPYYNEAGYEKQRGTQLGNENSRVYNEMAIIKIAHSTVKQIQSPPQIFRKELIEHFKEFGTELYDRMYAWSEYSAEAQRIKISCINDMPKDYKMPCEMPEFPLLPCSRGFCIAFKGVLQTLQNELLTLNKMEESEPIVMAKAPRAAPESV